MGLKEAILAAAAMPAALEAVEVPEWGATVYLRDPTLAEMEPYEAEVSAYLRDKDRPHDLVARRLALGLGDEAGGPLFTVEEAKQLRPRHVVRRLDDAIVARLWPKQADTEGNSPATASAGSASSSPGT